MANQFSLEAAKALIQLPYAYRQENLAVQYSGRCRKSTFAFVTQSAGPTIGGINGNTPLASLASTADGGYGPVNSGDTIVLCKVPAYARVTGGQFQFGAFGTSTTATIGTATVNSSGTPTVVDATHYLGSTSVASAGVTAIANTIALNSMEQVTVDTWLILTAGGANYTNGIALQGFIDWLLD